MGEERKLAGFYGGWSNYQQLLVGAIAPLDGPQLDLRAAPHLWSIREIGGHIAAARAWWFHDWLNEGGPELDDMADFDEGEASGQRSAAEIVRALEATWSMMESSLGRWSYADLDKEFARPRPNAAGERPRFSRQWIVWHVLEHDIHHGGEISFSLGMHGLVGIDL